LEKYGQALIDNHKLDEAVKVVREARPADYPYRRAAQSEKSARAPSGSAGNRAGGHRKGVVRKARS